MALDNVGFTFGARCLSAQARRDHLLDLQEGPDRKGRWAAQGAEEPGRAGFECAPKRVYQKNMHFDGKPPAQYSLTLTLSPTHSDLLGEAALPKAIIAISAPRPVASLPGPMAVM